MALRRSCHPTQLASPPAARAAAQLSALPVAQQCTQMPRNGSVRPFRRSVYTIVSPRAARATPASQQCTQMPQNSSERPFSAICVHYCVPPASPGGALATPAPQQCTQRPQNGSEETFSAICVHYCVTTGRPRKPRVATVYTNAPERRRRDVFGDLCTLLRPPASSPAARAGLAAQQCTQSRSP